MGQPIATVLKLLALIMLPLALIACETLSYYRQAVGGQLDLMLRRQDMLALIGAPDTPRALAARLETVLSLREFASRQLGLADNGAFSSYVDLERPFVVWNVFATPEFSMEPVRWCYPIAGCVSYRGYFSEATAEAYASRQRRKGRDVYVGGVAAYSTLGWFADPVLSTVIHRADHELASLVFHELAHQRVYVQGDTDFNESYATTVARAGLERWLAARYSQSDGQQVLAAIQQDIQRQEDFVALVRMAVAELEVLYATAQAPELMRTGKQAVIRQLRDDYGLIRASWGGYPGYDAWFAGSLNNAQLATVTSYYRWVPAFESLLQVCSGDLTSFHAAVERLAGLGQEARLLALQGYEAGSGRC